MNQSISRRSVLGGAMALGALPLLAACGSSGPGASGGASGGSGGLTEITVGYIADGNGASTAMIAEQQGLWEKHGLKATLRVFTNGPLQIQALGTGDIDFGYIGPGALWLPMQGKAKVAAIVSLGTADRVVAQSGITSIEQLAGKTVGVPEGTSGDMLLSLALEQAGMQTSDIKRVAMDPPTVVSAFAAGQIDGAAIWYPNVATMKKARPDLVEVVKSADFPELAFPASLVAAPSITERPEVLKAFQAVAQDANQWNHDHRAEMPGLLAAFLKAPPEGLASEQEFVEVFPTDELRSKSQDGTVDTWLRTLNELFVKLGKVDAVVDPKEYFLGAQYAKA